RTDFSPFIPYTTLFRSKAAPQMRSLLGRGVAVADGVRIVAPVGVLAVTVLSEMTPFALAARDIMLNEHQIAFPEALAPREFAPRSEEHTSELQSRVDLV